MLDLRYEPVYCCILFTGKHWTEFTQAQWGYRTGTKDITHLNIDNFVFENVKNFNYFGSILNADNKINIETERIAKGTKAYYTNAKLIKLKFLEKNTKMKIYKTMTRAVVTYSSET
jgi:hypothetical protein